MKTNNENELSRFEKIPLKIFNTSVDGSKYVAAEIARTICQKAKENKKCVLGLASGSSPSGVYAELIRLHKEDKLSFKNVVCFNLDEYYPMHPDSPQSFHYSLNKHLFNYIDIDPKNIYIPDGLTLKENIHQYCKNWEKLIKKFGGIDIQLLGIGRTGHIGFNEPGSPANSDTRLITLDHITLADAASDFYGEENVPHKAITMGVGTILKSKRIFLMGWGEGKSMIIKRTIEGTVSEEAPASFLQNHPQAKIILDEAAAAELTRIKTPWMVETCNWTDRLIRKGVIWLCQKVEKPILKLTERDYNDNGMSDLITEHGPAYKINIKVFNDLQHTITGWPGGKPNTDDSERPERANPYPKRVLIFSPHPDDDVISMGGTMIRLAEQGHQVFVAYQTSGNIAVFDDDVIRYIDLILEYEKEFGSAKKTTENFYNKIFSFFQSKTPVESDITEVQKLKTFIRMSEAKSACRAMGVNEKNIFFLKMPFYETGKIKKKEPGKADIKILSDLLRKVEPHQIYAAGDLSDPHGTHRVCFNAILKSLQDCKKDAWMKNCYLWLYRGAWQEWDINLVDMAVPLSPEELLKKRRAIFKHQSQKDRPLFPGVDTREFWQRAEARNRDTALLYDKLGMAEYEAMEVFVRYTDF